MFDWQLTNVADPGCLSRIRLFPIPDPNCLHPGSRIRIKEFRYFNPKKWFLSSGKYDPGCSSRIPDPDADFLPIPDPGVKKAPGPGSGSATLQLTQVELGLHRDVPLDAPIHQPPPHVRDLPAYSLEQQLDSLVCDCSLSTAEKQG